MLHWFAVHWPEENGVWRRVIHYFIILLTFKYFFFPPLQPHLPGPASKHCSWFTWACIQALSLIYLGLHPSTVLDLPGPASKHYPWFTWVCIQALFLICCKEYRLLGSTTRIRRTSVSHSKTKKTWKKNIYTIFKKITKILIQFKICI